MTKSTWAEICRCLAVIIMATGLVWGLLGPTLFALRVYHDRTYRLYAEAFFPMLLQISRPVIGGAVVALALTITAVVLSRLDGAPHRRQP